MNFGLFGIYLLQQLSTKMVMLYFLLDLQAKWKGLEAKIVNEIKNTISYITFFFTIHQYVKD